ncbi:hypothetical protein TNCV_4255201 [Trichonephila clavipes]|nr:hypothetical protein TNCV_4255201 [Trichonephila clavipes]
MKDEMGVPPHSRMKQLCRLCGNSLHRRAANCAKSGFFKLIAYYDRCWIIALPEVVEAVNSLDPSIEVYIDGGIRTGYDVFKAIALGARAAFIGRPILWGLTMGVRGLLLTEFHLIHNFKIRTLDNEKRISKKLTDCRMYRNIL